MEHIQEIRSLRQRLEESIKTNEKLRRQLERQGLEFEQGKKDLPKPAQSVRVHCLDQHSVHWEEHRTRGQRGFSFDPDSAAYLQGALT